MRFTGRTAVITGAASGIGEAITRRLHAEGASVLLADLDDAKGQALADELGDGRARFQHTDVTVWEEVASIVVRAERDLGRLDILCNNAGIGCFAATPDLALDDWRRAIDVNLNGVFYGCRAAIPVMRRQGGGAIVNTASASGVAGDYAFAAYNAAKGAVINYTRAAAIDHAAEGVRINAICPGPVDTPIIAGIKAWPGLREAWERVVPLGRFARAEEIAGVAAFLASDDATYVVGAAIAVDGGLTAHTGQPNLPRFMREASSRAES